MNMDVLTMDIVNVMCTSDPCMDMLIAMLILLIIWLLFDLAKCFEDVFLATLVENCKTNRIVIPKPVSFTSTLPLSCQLLHNSPFTLIFAIP
jgi:hypothetical protein